MKRIAAIAAAAMSVLSAGAAAAGPLHIVGSHGPVGHGPVFHGPVIGGPIYRGPVFGGPVEFQQWGYGAYVPRTWLVPARFVVDFVDFNLAPPPADYVWVRNGPQAMLVNLNTGMVVQVVPDAFA